MLIVLILLIGGINWGLIGAFEFNAVSYLNRKTFNSSKFLRTVYIIVGLSALMLLFKRDFYLPFLGKTVMPLSLFSPTRMSDYNYVHQLKVPNHQKYKYVLYWAAMADEGLVGENPQEAYADYNNMGIELIKDENVNLYVKVPEKYKVPFRGILPRHIHYRLVGHNGLLSRIHTIKVDN